MAGAITSVGLQGALSAAVLGPESLTAYAYAISGALSQSAALEPRPYQLHSIRAVTQLLPSPADTALWAMLSALVAWRTVAFWRGSAPLGARYAVVVLASVLVSPHLTIYDATILVLPLMLIGGWLETEGDPRRGRYWGLVYLLVVSFIVPVALMTGAQVSVGLQLWLFAIVSATPKVAR